MRRKELSLTTGWDGWTASFQHESPRLNRPTRRVWTACHFASTQFPFIFGFFHRGGCFLTDKAR